MNLEFVPLLGEESQIRSFQQDVLKLTFAYKLALDKARDDNERNMLNVQLFLTAAGVMNRFLNDVYKIKTAEKMSEYIGKC